VLKYIARNTVVFFVVLGRDVGWLESRQESEGHLHTHPSTEARVATQAYPSESALARKVHIRGAGPWVA